MRRNAINYFLITLLIIFSASIAFSQIKYRTFSQYDLSLKKAKAGKILNSNVSFVFKNDSLSFAVNGLHARLNSSINGIIDSGGFTNIVISERGKVFTATGRSVAAGDSARLIFNLDKKAPGAKASKWWWYMDGVQVGNKRHELTGTYQPIQIQPNGGTVRDYIYKHIIHRPQGLIVGMVTETLKVGWIRYKNADRKFFPHTDAARCFDVIATGSTITRPFDHKLQNPHVKKHNNHLLGEVHALKLAIIANDSGATQPLDTTALGDLIYNDLTNPGDPGNGLTLRNLVAIIDSALTYCHHFDLMPGIYSKFDTCVSRINRAFDGSYIAVSFNPFVLAGTHALEEIPFLHPNPTAVSVMRRGSKYSILDQMPELFTLQQNYPNPFNPSTTIDFNLAEPGIVTLRVFNLLGQEVATLLDREEMEDGEQSIEFNANNLTSGIYFYKIFAQGVGESKMQLQATKRMMLVK